MQVDGKEFLRNVNIEKEKAKLEKQKKNLDDSKVEAVKKEPDYFEPEDDAAYLDIAIDQNVDNLQQEDPNQLFDIKLESNNNDNKKKYIILALGLILLFIFTIVIIRLISNSEEEDKLKQQVAPKEQKVEEVKQNNKLNKIEEVDNSFKDKEVIEDSGYKNNNRYNSLSEKKDIILPEPVKEESPVTIESKPKANVKDLFGLEETRKVEPAKEIKEVRKPKPVVKDPVQNIIKKTVTRDEPKRTIAVKPPKETNFVKKDSSVVKGYFIQIGSFSKKPTNKYLGNISKKGFDYRVHRVNIKGKYYNKVLIGPYNSKSAARGSLQKVRNAFKVPGAYILKF